jgi:hypothetical protein
MDKIISLILSIIAPPLAIPIQIFNKLFQWRPPLSTVIAMIVAILALGGFTVQTVRINGLHIAPKIIFFKIPIIEIDGYKEINEKLLNSIKERDKKEQEYKKSQLETNSKVTTISRTGAEIVNDSRKILQPKIDKFVADYIKSHPVTDCLRGGINPSVFDGKADMPIGPGSPEGGDGKDVSSGWVAIRTSDLEGYAKNTRDVDELRAYFKWLIDNKIFIPYDEANKQK